MSLVKDYSMKILDAVKQRGYSKVTLSPAPLRELSFRDLEVVVRRNQVRHRGIFYPHIANHDYGRFHAIERGLESFQQWGDSVGIWRFFKSGQFEHLAGFVEDRWGANPPLWTQWDPATDVPLPANPFFDTIIKTWDLIEIFLFASNLANDFNCAMTIDISLHKMCGRRLETRTGRPMHGSGHVCHADTITLRLESVDSNKLLLDHDELAKEKLLELFGHFDWTDHSLISSIIDREQKEFYSHRW